MEPLISIIIPCYNSGKYLPDALASIEAYPNKAIYEVIIINDGSTDEQTLTLLDKLQSDGYTVIHQENQGPAAARNTGVRGSKAEYILFLDSDNKIRNSLIDKGIEVLSKMKSVGVVYGNAYFFGDTTQNQFSSQVFDMGKILETNYIDMCSIVRRKVWEQLGGLDEERCLIGHEDWDFWVRAKVAGWDFYFIDEVLFEYRVVANSLVKQASIPENYIKMLYYFRSKHFKLYIKYFKSIEKKKYLADILYNMTIYSMKNQRFNQGLKYLSYSFYLSNFNMLYLKDGLYWFKENIKSKYFQNSEGVSK